MRDPVGTLIQSGLLHEPGSFGGGTSRNKIPVSSIDRFQGYSAVERMVLRLDPKPFEDEWFLAWYELAVVLRFKANDLTLSHQAR